MLSSELGMLEVKNRTMEKIRPLLNGIPKSWIYNFAVAVMPSE